MEDSAKSRRAESAPQVRRGDGEPVLRAVRGTHGGLSHRTGGRVGKRHENSPEHGEQVQPSRAGHHRRRRVQLRLQRADVGGACDPGDVHGFEGSRDAVDGPAPHLAPPRAVPLRGLTEAKSRDGRRGDHPGGDHEARGGCQEDGGRRGSRGGGRGVGARLPQRRQPQRAAVPHRRAGGGELHAAAGRPSVASRRRPRDHRLRAHLGHVRAAQARERRAAALAARRARRGARRQALPRL